MLSASANNAITQAIIGRSRHTVPASTISALVGTGSPGSTTSAANNHHGCPLRKSSLTFHHALSVARSTPKRHASSSAPAPNTSKPPASR